MVRCVRIDKGAYEVLASLFGDDPEERQAALEFQRETFRARFGCGPEEMIEVADPEELQRERDAEDCRLGRA